MRVLILALAAAVALPLSACNKQDDEGPAKVVETPTRKPGLWKQVTTIEGMGAVPAVSLCLDEATDKKLAWWAQQGVRSDCRENNVSRNADGSWSFSTVCSSQDGLRTINEGAATGDFQSSYKVVAKHTTTGAPDPRMNGTRNITIESTWVGACTANMRPGDLQLPDGGLLNLIDVMGE